MPDGTLDASEIRRQRERMVVEQVERRGVREPSVLDALRSVPRHLFMPKERWIHAYEDRALSIGEGQTISQPYIVGLMTAMLRPEPGMRVLEIGTGSGYQAAILARCVGEVYTVENHANLSRRAGAVLRELGIGNVHLRVGDGHDGWPEHAPYDAILVTAAPISIPQPLVDQLKIGGRLVAPVGRSGDPQSLQLLTKTREGPRVETFGGVMFVPMTGKAEDAAGS